MKLSMIAGAGALPFILAEEAIRSGREIIIISVTKEYDERLSSLTPEFYQISPGRLKKIIDTLVKMDARELVIIGRVSKNLLFKPTRLDTKSIKILAKLRNKSDSSLFEAIAKEMESAGIELIDQRLYLSKLLPQKGVITKTKPSGDQLKDVEYGMALARDIARLGIGQTVVVRNQVPLAIEAIEGTDEAIRRGGKLCKSKAVVAKAARPDHDFRFDVPTIGADTIDVLIEAEASAMAIESGKAFLLEREETVRKADKAGIALVVV